MSVRPRATAPKAPALAPERNESVRAAAQEAAERIRAAGALARTAPSPARLAIRPKPKRKVGPLVAAAIVLAALAAIAVWNFRGASGEAPVQPAGTPDEGSANAGTAQPDSTQLAELEKLPGTSDADWAQIQAWVGSAIDPAAPDADGARAHLAEHGREAFPALLAALARLDLATEPGRVSGERAHAVLSEIAKGKQLAWRSSTAPQDALANRETVKAWREAWQVARTSPAAWAELAKVAPAEAAALFERTGPVGN